MDLSNLNDEALIALYKKTQRQVDQLDIEGCGKGAGANIYPIMGLIPRPDTKPTQQVVDAIFCPGKNQKNAFTRLPDVRETMVKELVKIAVKAGGTETGVRVAEKLSTTLPIESSVHVSECPEPNPPTATDGSLKIISDT